MRLRVERFEPQNPQPQNPQPHNLLLLRIFLVSGEASGDLHASLLMQSLQVELGKTDFCYWGGDKMAAVGGTLKKHYRELAFMGFWEVVKNLRTITRNLDSCFADIQAFQPDVLILVDYSGFNLRIAKKAKEAGIRIFYYISPQVWASRAGRVKKIKKFVDEMFVILPFEENFYKQYEFPVHFIGHPLLDVVKNYRPTPDFRKTNRLSDKPIVALLPGSRKQEIRAMLAEMLATVPHFPDYQFVIAGAPSMTQDFYKAIITELPKSISESVHLIENQTYDLFSQAEAALVTSGTATLEAALFRVPQVVCYKGGAISYAIAKRIIQVKFISLVNLILDREVVKELIQGEMNATNLRIELQSILEIEGQKKLKVAYDKLADKLGNSGAVKRAAQIMAAKLLH